MISKLKESLGSASHLPVNWTINLLAAGGELCTNCRLRRGSFTLHYLARDQSNPDMVRQLALGTRRFENSKQHCEARESSTN